MNVIGVKIFLHFMKWFSFFCTKNFAIFWLVYFLTKLEWHEHLSFVHSLDQAIFFLLFNRFGFLPIQVAKVSPLKSVNTFFDNERKIIHFGWRWSTLFVDKRSIMSKVTLWWRCLNLRHNVTIENISNLFRFAATPNVVLLATTHSHKRIRARTPNSFCCYLYIPLWIISKRVCYRKQIQPCWNWSTASAFGKKRFCLKGQLPCSQQGFLSVWLFVFTFSYFRSNFCRPDRRRSKEPIWWLLFQVYIVSGCCRLITSQLLLLNR